MPWLTDILEGLSFSEGKGREMDWGKGRLGKVTERGGEEGGRGKCNHAWKKLINYK